MSTMSILFVCCSIYNSGCTQKKFNDLNARRSAEWVRDAVIYEINLRSFPKEGTFKAFEAEIPLLKKRGMTVISFMPIHPLGELERKGNLGNLNAVKDFYAVNPEFGTLDDFKALVNIVHQQGLKIIINLVAGQVAWDSQLLMEHPDWFVHNEEGAIVSPDVENGDAAQLNYNQHELRKYMIALMKFWVQEIGIDGFQCRSEELIPTEFWDVARSELDKAGPVLMISEGRLPEHHLKAFDLTWSWDMNTACANIADGKVPASVINDSLNAELLKYPKGSMHLRSNRAQEKKIEDAAAINISDPQRAKTIAFLTFTLPGVPLVRCGDEAGDTKKIGLLNNLYEDVSTLHWNHPALRYGSYVNVQNSAPSQLYSFIRCSGKDSVLVVVNFANEKKEADIQMPVDASVFWKDQLSGVGANVKNARLSVTIGAMGVLALVPFSEKEMK